MKILKFLLLIMFPWSLHSAELSDSFSVKVPLDTVGEIFSSVEATLEPKDGMDAFFDRLGMYLNLSKELSSTYLHFYVAPDGKLYLQDTSYTAKILRDFIRNEKYWSPGIHSGPTKLTCIYVELPIQKEKKRLITGISPTKGRASQ